jgi:hypothetical protein
MMFLHFQRITAFQPQRERDRLSQRDFHREQKFFDLPLDAASRFLVPSTLTGPSGEDQRQFLRIPGASPAAWATGIRPSSLDGASDYSHLRRLAGCLGDRSEALVPRRTVRLHALLEIRRLPRRPI